VALVHTVAPAPVLAYLALPDSGQTKSVQHRLSSASHVHWAQHPLLLEQTPAARVWSVLQASTTVLKAVHCARHALLDATAQVAASKAMELRVRQERIRSIQQQAAALPALSALPALTAPATVPSPQSRVPPMEAASLQLQALQTPASAGMWPAQQVIFVPPVLAPQLRALQATTLLT